MLYHCYLLRRAVFHGQGLTKLYYITCESETEEQVNFCLSEENA